MRLRQLLVTSLLTMMLGGCSTHVAVTVDHDASANFTALHTYAWRPNPPLESDDPRFDSRLIDTRVRAAIERVLAARGYRKAQAGTAADFLVGYEAVVRQKTTFHSVNQRYRYRVGGGWPQTYADEYNEGTLIIDVIDPANMDLLWRGIGTGVVDPQASPEKRERRIDDAVDAILIQFPPS